MDSKSFQESRQQKLDDFMTQYKEARADYNNTITTAIYEQDPKTQQDLILKVVADNKKMSDALKDFLTIMNAGTDQLNKKILDQLVADLATYQQQYQDIQDSNDKIQTLKTIQATLSANLSSATQMFYIYLAALMFLCLIIALLAIRSAWTTDFFSQTIKMFKGAARRR